MDDEFIVYNTINDEQTIAFFYEQGNVMLGFC